MAEVKRCEKLRLVDEGDTARPTRCVDTKHNHWRSTGSSGRCTEDDDIRLLHLSFADEKAEQKWEASLRKSNPGEAKRLDELLAGALNQVW